MSSQQVGAAAVLSVLMFGVGTARAIEVRAREVPEREATEAVTPDPESDASAAITSTYRESGSPAETPGLTFRSGDDGSDRSSVVAAATDGTYTGTVGGSSPFSLTVSGNKITSWTVQNLNCPNFTVTQSGITTSCSIAGNNSFTCGGLGCSLSGNMRISGSFSGNTVSGTFDADYQPFGSCCSFRGLALSATRASTPNAPSNLVATARSDDEIELDWTDNSNNETEFRVESKTASSSFVDIGAVGANIHEASVTGLNPSTTYTFRVRARNASGNSGYSNEASATTFGGPSVCTANSTTLCLNNDRFKVQATFETAQPQSGQAQVVELTTDTGYLWFFSSTNVEAVIKVINACSFNNRYWVFAGGLTDVRVVLTVTDTQTGAVKTYTNPLGTKFAPIQDTSAFATCP